MKYSSMLSTRIMNYVVNATEFRFNLNTWIVFMDEKAEIRSEGNVCVLAENLCHYKKMYF